MKCAALGCPTGPAKDGAGIFCKPHWRALPEELRGPTSVKQAIKFLGVKDGYLIAPKTARPSLREDGKASEYV